MTIEASKKAWKHLFAENKLKALISALGAALLPTSAVYSVYLNLARRYNEVQDAKMAGILDYGEAAKESNKIGQAILGFIQDLTEGDIGPPNDLEKPAIKNPILVLTSDASAQAYLVAFFRETDFANVTVQLFANVSEAILGYDLIVIDNQDLKACPHLAAKLKLPPSDQALIEERIALMETLKAKTTCFFIHFGEFLYWVSANRERVHAANSKFSLFARVREMVGFINTYRV